MIHITSKDVYAPCFICKCSTPQYLLHQINVIILPTPTDYVDHNMGEFECVCMPCIREVVENSTTQLCVTIVVTQELLRVAR